MSDIIPLLSSRMKALFEDFITKKVIGGESYLDSIIDFCEEYDMEETAMPVLIDETMENHILEEAILRRLLPKPKNIIDI